uniref:Uncharacterized protein n=1 Tax=Rhizophora mucronata TaxID=61149 RepID=A0A2P2Q5B2_RHIMU
MTLKVTLCKNRLMDPGQRNKRLFLYSPVLIGLLFSITDALGLCFSHSHLVCGCLLGWQQRINQLWEANYCLSTFNL